MVSIIFLNLIDAKLLNNTVNAAFQGYCFLRIALWKGSLIFVSYMTYLFINVLFDWTFIQPGEKP